MSFVNRITMKIELRNLYFDDYFGLKEAMIEAYAGIGGDYWQLDDIKKLLDIFPEGQLCVLVDGKVVASALSIIVDYKKFGDNHTFSGNHRKLYLQFPFCRRRCSLRH